MQSCDIVVTNPPFSLFREYVTQLMQYNKQFLIIGNMNAITYKEFFPLIKENRVWVGNGFNKTMRFEVPNIYQATTVENGRGYVDVPAICWYTNLGHLRRHEPLILHKRYISDAYSSFVHYNAINVDKTMEIPMDYDGVMGVPISFLGKHCIEQFEIVGFPKRDESVKQNFSAECGLITGAKQTICTDGRSRYARIAIRHRW